MATKSVYFDSSVFLAILNGDSSASQIRELLKELQRDKIKVITSIITVQEVSVASYKSGTIASDNHGKVRKIARIESITRDVALTAAKLEAQIIDGYKNANEKTADNKRRKWDCFHIATAQCMTCSHLYSIDDGMLKRKSRHRINDIDFLEPKPSAAPLFKGSIE